MKKERSIVSLTLLVILSSVLSTGLFADGIKKSVVDYNSTSNESTFSGEDWFTPYLVINGETQVSLTSNVPSPDLSENSQSKNLKNNTAGFLKPSKSSIHLNYSEFIYVSLSISKLIFPFHSFL